MRAYRILINNCFSSSCLVSITRQTHYPLRIPVALHHCPCYPPPPSLLLVNNCSPSSSSSSSSWWCCWLPSCLLNPGSPAVFVCSARTCMSIPRLSRSSLVWHFVNWECSVIALVFEFLGAKFRYRRCRLTKYSPMTITKRATRTTANAIAIRSDDDNEFSGD